MLEPPLSLEPWVFPPPMPAVVSSFRPLVMSYCSAAWVPPEALCLAPR